MGPRFVYLNIEASVARTGRGKKKRQDSKEKPDDECYDDEANGINGLPAVRVACGEHYTISVNHVNEGAATYS